MQHIVPAAQSFPRTVAVRPNAPSLAAVDLDAFVADLFRRRTLLLAIFIACFSAVLLGTQFMPKSYTSTVKFIAGAASAQGSSQNVSVDSGMPILNALLAANGGQTSETYAELLRQQPVAQRVIDRLHLHLTPTELYRHVLIRPVSNTSILTLAVTWSDPVNASRIANAFADVYVERQRELVASQATSAMTRLQREIPQAERRYHNAVRALNAYQNRYAITDIAAQTQAAVSSQAALVARVDTVRSEHDQAEAQLQALKRDLAVVSHTVVGQSNVTLNTVRTAVEAQLQDADVNLVSARQHYTAEYPLVAQLQNRRDSLQRQLAHMPRMIASGTDTVVNPVYQQLREQVATTTALVDSTAAQLASLERSTSTRASAMGVLPNQASSVGELRRSVTEAEDIANALRHKFGEASVARTAALGDIAVTERAFANAAIRSPDIAKNLLLGALVAVLVAFIAGLLFSYFDRSLKDPAQAETALALPIFASIPRLDAKTSARALPVLRAQAMDSIWRLLTALRFASDVPLKTLLVASAEPGEGKTTVAIRIAVAMAEIEPGVLLVDADMRRSSVHAKLGVENAGGLSDVLVSRMPLASAIQRSPHAGLDVLTSGTAAPSPGRLLQSANFDRMLREASSLYRMVIVDSAALDPVFDAAQIAAKVDGTLLVVAVHESDLQKSRRAVRALESVGITNILGMVVNKADPGRQNGSSDYFADTIAQAGQTA